MIDPNAQISEDLELLGESIEDEVLKTGRFPHKILNLSQPHLSMTKPLKIEPDDEWSDDPNAIIDETVSVTPQLPAIISNQPQSHNLVRVAIGAGVVAVLTTGLFALRRIRRV